MVRLRSHLLVDAVHLLLVSFADNSELVDSRIVGLEERLVVDDRAERKLELLAEYDCLE